MAKKFFHERKPHNGMTYEKYLEKTKRHIEKGNQLTLSGKEKKFLEYTKLNYHRSMRIQKKYVINEGLKSVVKKIDTPQLWMVLTEKWCGDSAQSLPIIAKIAEVSPNIDLRILLRDENLDIMNHYLTNGKSISIPKLVAFDLEGEELFTWGPRPDEAQQLVSMWKSNGLHPDIYHEKLHGWYANDKGRKIEEEILEIISKMVR